MPRAVHPPPPKHTRASSIRHGIPQPLANILLHVLRVCVIRRAPHVQHGIRRIVLLPQTVLAPVRERAPRRLKIVTKIQCEKGAAYLHALAQRILFRSDVIPENVGGAEHEGEFDAVARLRGAGLVMRAPRVHAKSVIEAVPKRA